MAAGAQIHATLLALVGGVELGVAFVAVPYDDIAAGVLDHAPLVPGAFLPFLFLLSVWMLQILLREGCGLGGSLNGGTEWPYPGEVAGCHIAFPAHGGIAVDERQETILRRTGLTLAYGSGPLVGTVQVQK